MIYQMCVFRVEPYDPPSFLGALFLLVCLLFFLKPKKQQSFLGNVFCLFLFCCFSETSSPKSAKNTENTFVFLVCVWLVLSLCLQNQAPYKKQRNKLRKN